MFKDNNRSYTASYKNFKDDNYRNYQLHNHRSNKNRESKPSYQMLKYNFENGKITEKEARKEIKNYRFDSGAEISDAFKKHLISSGQALSLTKDLKKYKHTSNLSKLNQKITAGKVGNEKAARAGITFITLASNGKIKGETSAYIQKSVIPKRESVASHHIAEKLRHGSHIATKFAGKSSKALIKGTGSVGRTGFKIVSRGFKEQLGGSNGIIQDEAFSGISGSAKSVATSGIRHTRSFAGSTFSSIRAHINYRKEFSKSTVTEKDILKIQKARESGNTRKQKKAEDNLKKKINRKGSVTHYATKLGHGTGASASSVVKGTLKTGKGAVKSGAKTGASAGRFATRQFSKITTDTLGHTDETVSSIGHAAKTTTKYTFKAAKTAVKAPKRIARATRAVVQAVRTAVNAVVNIVTAIVSAIIPSLPVLIPILAIAIVLVFIIFIISSCMATIPATIATALYDNIGKVDFLSYADEDTILEAERLYSEAEADLMTYAASFSYDEAISMADPKNQYDLTTGNTSLVHDYTGVTYHNPYCLISYLCVKYGEGWTISDVECEWDYNNTDSLIYKQYTIDVALSKGKIVGKNSSDTDIQNQLVAFARDLAEKQYPYVQGGRGKDMCPGYENTHPEADLVFDCSGLTAYTYLEVMHVQLPYNVASISSSGVTSGQWYCGTPISKGNTYDEFISKLEPGDLIFMNNNNGVPGHVGIYTGDGMFVDASSYMGYVIEESITGRNFSDYYGARRILGSEWLSNQNVSSSDDGYTITTALRNNGMDATIRELLSDDDEALELYLTMLYYYGVEDEDDEDNVFAQEWPHDTYKTHADGQSLEDFIYSGNEEGFNIDETLSGQSEKGTVGYYSEATGYAWPLNGYTTITSACGWRTLNGQSEYHTGIDISAPGGTEILLSKSGTVVKNEWNNARGWMVQVDHGDGYLTIYQHMNAKSLLELNKSYEQGTVVGYVGNTGYSFGNHLHFEVWVNNGRSWPDNVVNPMTTLFKDLTF